MLLWITSESSVLAQIGCWILLMLKTNVCAFTNQDIILVQHGINNSCSECFNLPSCQIWNWFEHGILTYSHSCGDSVQTLPQFQIRKLCFAVTHTAYHGLCQHLYLITQTLISNSWITAARTSARQTWDVDAQHDVVLVRPRTSTTSLHSHTDAKKGKKKSIVENIQGFLDP